MRRGMVPWLLVLALLAGCDSHLLRREFYRGELRHLHQEGVRQYREGDYPAAERTFRRILQLDPGNEAARLQLAHLALARGEGGRASEAYRAIMEEEPGQARAIEPYLAYAVTLPPPGSETAADEPRDGPVSGAGTAAGGARERPLFDRRPVARLRSLLEGVPEQGTGELRRFVLDREDLAAWVYRWRRAFTPERAAINTLLPELYREGELTDCTPCLELAALWYGERTEGERLELLEAVLGRTDLRKELREEITYRLGLALERAGRRAEAIRRYLSIADYPRARARLERR